MVVGESATVAPAGDSKELRAAELDLRERLAKALHAEGFGRLAPEDKPRAAKLRIPSVVFTMANAALAWLYVCCAYVGLDLVGPSTTVEYLIATAAGGAIALWHGRTLDLSLLERVGAFPLRAYLTLGAFMIVAAVVLALLAAAAVSVVNGPGDLARTHGVPALIVV